MTQFSDGAQWLAFRVDNVECCILSEYLESISIPGKVEPVPESPAGMAGIMMHKGKPLDVIEVRELFGRLNLEDYKVQFNIMKEMHVSWVEDLERYVREGGEFTKAIDPHKCKFGLWYDAFRTDNARLNRLLKKITTPHEKIHRCGAEIMKLKENEAENRERIEEWLEEAKCICYEDIVPLLDRLIDIYHAVNRGVILVVNDGINRAGLLVDGVRMLVPCSKTKQQELNDGVTRSKYVRALVIAEDRPMLELAVEEMLFKG